MLQSDLVFPINCIKEKPLNTMIQLNTILWTYKSSQHNTTVSD